MGKKRCGKCNTTKTTAVQCAADDLLLNGCFEQTDVVLRNMKVSDNAGSRMVDCRSSSCDSGTMECRLVCDFCDGCFHPRDMGITDDTYANLQSIILVTGWVCATCRKDIYLQYRVMKASHAKLAEEIASLKAEVQQVKSEFENYRKTHPEPPVAWPPAAANQCGLLSAVHKELSDKKRRQKNVVITGLAPLDDTSDADLFMELCENCLPVKPHIDQSKCRRLGKRQQGKVQPLRIVLDDEESALNVLKSAHLLRNSDVYQRVFINPDRTPAEAQAAFEQREKRRQARMKTTQQSDVIYDGVHDRVATAFSADALEFLPGGLCGGDVPTLNPSAPPFRVADK